MRYFLPILLVFGAFSGSAQFIEFGGGIGGINYSGDLVNYPQILETKPGVTAIYRMNLSEVVSFRFALVGGKISGNDDNPIDILGERRSHTFNNGLVELSGAFEYHFLPYRSDKSRNRWSPYAFAGFGFVKFNDLGATYEEVRELQPVIPMGGGVKYQIGKQFTLSLEAGARKTFFDYLDGISDGDQRIKNYRYGNPNDKDWYYYTGITLTYVLYKIPCPFPYVPNRSILNKIRAF